MYDHIACEKFCKLIDDIKNVYDEKGQIQSTYKADYTLKELPERIERKVETVLIDLPFEGTTTYKNDYKEFKIPKIERKPKLVEKYSLPFEGITTYTSDYSLRAWDYYMKG